MAEMYPVLQPRRPTGVTVLAILQLLVGAVDILTGVLLLVAGTTLAIVGFGMSAAFAFMLIPLSIVLFAFGAISFILAYGLWKGRQWGWISSTILASIGLALGVLSLLGGELASVATIVIEAIILIYLSTYNVRAFFGRVKYQARYPPAGQPYLQPTGVRGMRNTFSPNTCIACGNTISYVGNFCDRCGTRLR